MRSKLILGTVQFGLNYGINNSSGKPSEKEVFNILDTAFENRIEFLDTADAYGNAIEVIGKYHLEQKNRFKILSKFKGVKSNELKNHVIDALVKLQIDNFEVYSFHSYNDFVKNPAIKWKLLELKNSKFIKKIGISVYSNEEFENVLTSGIFDVVQIPFNMLDNNNIRGSLLKQAKTLRIEIHIRSVFLQGLFFINELPTKLKPIEKYLSPIKSFCINNSISIQELALSYAIYNQNINKILIGVDNNTQLLANINSIKDNPKAFDFIDNNISVKEIQLLNPVNWK